MVRVCIIASNAIATDGRRAVQVQSSTSNLQTIVSMLHQGDTLTLRATGGTVNLALGGNIDLGTQASPFPIPAGGLVILTRMDANWALTGKSF